MNLVTPFLQALLGAALLAQAAISAFRPTGFAASLALLPKRRAGRLACIVVPLLAGIASLAGMVVPFIAFFAACLALLCGVTLAVFQRRASAENARWLASFIIVASLGVAALQPLGLKVLLLPKAAELVHTPLPARVVKTYKEGTWFEGIAAGADGTLYLAANRGLDFARSDYYHGAQGELIARSSDGAERSLLKTPVGTTAGVIAVAADGALYMSSHGETSGIWRIAGSGQAEIITRFPAGAWPNGLAFGPDGMLYVADSSLGLVWRIDPATGSVARALVDGRLAARPYIALAPGANGIHFRGRDMIVTVSDRAEVLAYALQADGRFSPPAVLASGIPGDDFAIGADGSLFITTHPYDTLVRVTPAGVRTIVGNAQQHIVGATDAVFGRGRDDRGTLYVVTDGGAFTGGPSTRGQLIALTP